MIPVYLLILLGILFVLLEIPLALLFGYLYKKRDVTTATQELRLVLLYLTGTKFLFMLAEIMTVVFSLFRISNSTPFVVIIFIFTTGLLVTANWYAFFTIKRLITKGE